MDGEMLPIRKVGIEAVTIKHEASPDKGKATVNSPVGIFDSGVGGLTVMSEFVRQLPNEDVIYLADTARVPYGGRPEEEIIKINQEIMSFFIGREAKLVIIACGTSSSIAYPKEKDKYHIPMVAMIEPGARAALAATRSGKIGVMATMGTVNSGAFPKAIHEMKKEAEVHQIACPLFVPLIEGGFIEADETRKVAKEYLKPLLKEGVDTIILGCTHYPHLKRVIAELADGNITLIDPASEVVRDAKAVLNKRGLIKSKPSPAKYEYFVTGSPVQFSDIASRLMGRPVAGVKQVKL
ncbi:MAG TPA: glutamate racemase [Candidatus Omnitrophota bacterium]|nr:glutamate racemase [Candidatus Omnitrophota bacterium]